MSTLSENSKASRVGRGKFGNRGSTPRGGKSGLSRGAASVDAHLRGGRGKFSNRGRGGSPGSNSSTPRGKNTAFQPRGRGAAFNSRGRVGRNENSSIKTGPPAPCKFVFIKGFPKTTETSDIEKLVKNAVNIHHKHGSQFATIEFNDIDSAEAAITTLKSKEIDGNQLIVQFDRRNGGGDTPNGSFKQNSNPSRKYKKSGDNSDEEDGDGPTMEDKKTKSIGKPKIANGNMSDEEDEDEEIDDENLEDENESDESVDDSVKVKSAKTALKQVKQKLDVEEINDDEDNEDESNLSEEDLDDTDEKQVIAKTKKAIKKRQLKDDGSDHKNISLSTSKAKKKQLATKRNEGVKSAIVRIENLPKKTKVEEIKKLVANIVSVEKGNNKTFAKVKFSDIKSAEIGITKLNCAKLRGNLLKASFFVDQSPDVKKTESLATVKVKAKSNKSPKAVVKDESDEGEDDVIDDEDDLEDEDDELLDSEEIEGQVSSDENKDEMEEDDDSNEVIEETNPPIKKAGNVKTPVKKAKEKQMKLNTTNTNVITPQNKKGKAGSAQSTPHPSVGKLSRTQNGDIVQPATNANRKRKAPESIATERVTKRSNNTMANGVPVDEAILVEEERRRKENNARTLYVNNVDPKLDYKRVKKILPDCVSIRKGGNLTFAFLTFDSEAAAIKAKEHIDRKPFSLCKQKVTVDFVGDKSTKGDQKSKSGQPSGPAAKSLINPLCLYVGNLPADKSYTKAKVVEYFPNATAVRINKKKHRAGNFMFVDFASAQDARQAFDNSANLSIDDHSVEVCYARMSKQELAAQKASDGPVIAATKAQKKRSDTKKPKQSNAKTVKKAKNDTSKNDEKNDDIELDSEDDDDEEMDEMEAEDSEDDEKVEDEIEEEIEDDSDE